MTSFLEESMLLLHLYKAREEDEKLLFSPANPHTQRTHYTITPFSPGNSSQGWRKSGSVASYIELAKESRRKVESD